MSDKTVLVSMWWMPLVSGITVLFSLIIDTNVT
jgi:hypothetical protein